ncbi:MAG: single-stranded-DNA-specific exonuclease RecJ [Anaerolineae bacterium]|nr:single-stranded-DNA-specific exonuclease RecJ [Anaerolineae bacterium]MDH7473690.1 single-stranded-DNA-specific exonuclease RecJ [Anaerolineae bacterium]
MTETTWLDPQPTSVPPALHEAVGGHPLVAEMLARRGVLTAAQARAFLDSDAYLPASPYELPDLSRAVERIEIAVNRGERICVWGDFDVDGQTATAVLVEALRARGANVIYHIPNRRESHGIHRPVLERIIATGTRLLVTCDTGSTAHEAIAYAKTQDVDVIVTDHHDLPPEFPPAYALINPKRLPAHHPLHELPGVGTAYKLVEALYASGGQPSEAARALDLVALGVVADVATLTGDVRYLLQKGLEVLRHTERLGLQALFQCAELNPAGLTEDHIAFILAPRLNALGRLAEATIAVELFTTDDLTRARTIASETEGLNSQRQLLTKQVLDAALAQIARDSSLRESSVLVLTHPTWSAGVIGIVAGRLAERFGKPAVLISAPPGELARGSARSVPGCDIHAAIAAQAPLLHRFGGHPMAAGFSIEAERIPEFRAALARTIEAMTGGTLTRQPLQIDAYLSLSNLSLDLVAQLNRLAPFGPGNPPVCLATRNLRIINATTIGRTDEHRKLLVEDEAGTTQTVLWWQGADWPLPEGPFDLAYTARASDYQGQPELELEWLAAREAERPSVVVQGAAPAIEIIDYRRASEPEALLRQLLASEGIQVWAEGKVPHGVPGLSRDVLSAGETLVIWSVPPGPDELQAVIKRVSPQRVILFATNPGMDEPMTFLQRLAGLVRHSLRVREGQTSLSALAAATAQRETTVQAGLQWLAAKGQVRIIANTGHQVTLAAGDGQRSAEVEHWLHRVVALLEETAAYRAYFARADTPIL